jgi:hypothetical protein
MTDTIPETSAPIAARAAPERGAPMHRVLMSCPADGRTVSTVQRMRPAGFEAMTGRFSFRCAACGDIHHWRKEDAWLEPATGALPKRPV